MNELSNIGFIGLGAMGFPMMLNINAKIKGRTIVYDRVPAVLEKAEQAGAIVAASPKEVAEKCDLVITMLPADTHVDDVVTGRAGVLEGARSGMIYADFSTIGPFTMKKVAAALADKGVRAIGASVTRGVEAAHAGTLAIYVDGDEKDLQAARGVFETFAATIEHVGDLGNAKVMKLVNNHMVGVSVAFTAEALALGAKAGVPPEILIPLLMKGSGSSYALKYHFDKFVMTDNLEPGRFGTKYILKDLELALEMAHRVNAPAFFNALALSYYRGASAMGYAEHYYPIVIRWLEKIANMERITPVRAKEEEEAL